MSKQSKKAGNMQDKQTNYKWNWETRPEDRLADAAFFMDVARIVHDHAHRNHHINAEFRARCFDSAPTVWLAAAGDICEAARKLQVVKGELTISSEGC